jgi:hypothetical protein
MSDLSKYMNDPDIINEPMPLREIHAIRLQLQGEYKGMTPEERSEHINEKVSKIMEQYGISHLLVPKREIF